MKRYVIFSIIVYCEPLENTHPTLLNLLVQNQIHIPSIKSNLNPFIAGKRKAVSPILLDMHLLDIEPQL